MEDDICLGHLFHPVGRQGVNHAGQYCQRGHHADRRVGVDGVVEIPSHGHCREKHLCSTIFRGGNTSNLKDRVSMGHVCRVGHELTCPRRLIQPVILIER